MEDKEKNVQSEPSLIQDDQQKTPGKQKKQKRWGVVQWLMTLLGIAIIVWGVKEGISLFQDHTENVVCDDAQVEQYLSPINAKVQGFIKEIRFTEHQYVHKGDTLLIIDDSEYRIQLKQAEAMIEQAKAGENTQTATMATIDERVGTVQVGEAIAAAGVEAAMGAITSAQSKVDEARIAMEDAKRDYDRYESLLAKDAATPMQFDKAKAAYDAAVSRYQSAQAGLGSVKSQAEATRAQHIQATHNTRTTAATKDEQRERIEQTKANTHAAMAQRDLFQLYLSYTIITAPCDGWVGRRNIQEGQLINPGTTITSIIPDTPKWVVANFKETQAGYLSVGKEVVITIDAIKNREFKGRITSIANATGSKFSSVPTDNSAGNFVKIQQRIPVRIDFDNAGKDDYHQMATGMMAIVKVKAE